jgi:hypothetical protein
MLSRHKKPKKREWIDLVQQLFHFRSLQCRFSAISCVLQSCHSGLLDPLSIHLGGKKISVIKRRPRYVLDEDRDDP